MGVKFCEKSGAWIDGYVKEWLDKFKRVIDKNWDAVFLIDGVEGSGKSSLAFTCAYYLDRTFTHDRIVFTAEQAIEAIDAAQPGESIVWDEFILGGLSTDAMTGLQKVLIKKTTTIRKKRLYIILVMPWIFMMNKYFAIGRSRCLLHTSTPDGESRGYLKIYDYNQKKKLYIDGKKYYEYNQRHRKAEFGDFKTWNIIDYEAYESKKDEAIKSIDTEDNKKDKKKDKKFRDALGKIINGGLLSVNYSYLQELTGIPERTLSRLKTEAAAANNINNTEFKGVE